MEEMKCKYCDDHGFCVKYSNGSVVWKCRMPCKDMEVKDG